MPNETPQSDDANKRPGPGRAITSTTLFLAVALAAALGFVAGTRSAEIYAAVAPIFGVKASADKINTALLQEAYRDLVANYDGDLDTNALIDGATRGMVSAVGDRYTVFMDKEEAEEFTKDLSGEVSGIGCEIGVRGDQPTVLRVLDDSPAKRAGLRAGDVFVSVNGESVVGLDASTTASKIRGDIGTSVKVAVARAGEKKEFTITRAKVSDASVRYSTEGDYGKIIISRFDTDTGNLTRRAAEDLKARGVKGIILDLRGNGGGYLDAARDVASVWLNDKVVVTEQAHGKQTDSIKSGKSAVLDGIKTVVLVDGNTASASEIVAGALQEYGVATLVGERTFGKGTVQQLIDLPDGRKIKITIARWFTPKGRNITKEGIEPDVKIQLTSDDTNKGRDPQLDAAIEQLAG